MGLQHVCDSLAGAALYVVKSDEQGIKGTGMPILFSRRLGVRYSPSRFHQIPRCYELTGCAILGGVNRPRARRSSECPSQCAGIFGVLQLGHLPTGMKKARNVARLTSRADTVFSQVS